MTRREPVRCVVYRQSGDGHLERLGALMFAQVPARGDFLFLEGLSLGVAERRWRFTLEDRIEADLIVRRLARAAWTWADAA